MAMTTETEVVGGVLVSTQAIETLAAGPSSCRACGAHAYSRCIEHGGFMVSPT